MGVYFDRLRQYADHVEIQLRALLSPANTGAIQAGDVPEKVPGAEQLNDLSSDGSLPVKLP